MPDFAKLNPEAIKLFEQLEQNLKSKGQEVVLIAYENKR